MTRENFNGQEGFTLLEAVMATGILITGLVAVSNLMFVAISSNAIGNRSSAAAFIAAQKMEELRSISFPALAPSAGSTLDLPLPAFTQDDTVEGIGTFRTNWTITVVAAIPGNKTKYIAVRTEMLGALGRLTQAEFTSFRACTLSPLCPL